MSLSYASEYPDEVAAIGRMLIGYGEIEYLTCVCLFHALGPDTAFRVMYRSRGESQRITIADAIMQPVYIKAKMGRDYAETFKAISHCRTIRNQYAHCHLAPRGSGGDLSFVSFEDAATANGGDMTITIRRVSPDLLRRQEDHFEFARAALIY